ncbi:serine/threonine-protein kinase pim-2-like [Oratosquilla oratoria]|uniref:serine/threonine-protein kinase pim-2-like n=1 Tax=Oratosquilla oratoria TaxID=337810 RepID=UPI003F764ED9
MELVPSAMSLYDYIEDDNELSNVEVQTLFKKIITTIEGCIQAGVSHKDIKPENILLFRNKSSEYIKGGQFLDVPATVWILGTLLYYMACRDDPFYTNASICRASPSFPKNVPNLCRDLIMRCFVKDPWARLSLHRILSHPWLAGQSFCLGKTEFNAELDLETADVARRKPKKKKLQRKPKNVSLITKKKGKKRDHSEEDDTPQGRKRL